MTMCATKVYLVLNNQNIQTLAKKKKLEIPKVDAIIELANLSRWNGVNW